MTSCCEKLSKLKNDFRWEKFKHFFQITIFKYFVLWFAIVPALAAIINKIPQNISLKSIDKNQTLDISFPLNWDVTLPFTWQVLWLSSFFFMIALLIYFFLCPSFIKKYNQFSDYLKHSHAQRWLAWEASFLMRTIRNDKPQVQKFIDRLTKKEFLEELSVAPDAAKLKEPQVEKNQTKFYFEFEGKYYVLPMPILKSGEEVVGSEKEVFWEIFGRYSESKSCARLFILFCLLISGGLFSWVLLEHMWAGLHLVYTWFQHL